MKNLIILSILSVSFIACGSSVVDFPDDGRFGGGGGDNDGINGGVYCFTDAQATDPPPVFDAGTDSGIDSDPDSNVKGD